MSYVCGACGKRYPLETNEIMCSCSGLFGLEAGGGRLDFSAPPGMEFPSLWRYIDALPFERDDPVWRAASMGEGATPLFRMDPSLPELFVKAEYFAPTLSFKDRGAAVLVPMAKKLGHTRLVADSSGNAGTAIAAYAARLGLSCDIYVPDSTSEKKIEQIEAHGAVIHRIPGSREDTAAAAMERVARGDVFYASHVYNPFFYEGTKTYVYEVFEQLGGRLPDRFIVPVGNGTLALGVFKALCEMKEWGVIGELPGILAVQAERCAPIATAFKRGGDHVPEVETGKTLAEGIAIAVPKRGAEILRAVRQTGGEFVTVSEEEILAAQDKMARLGVFVELTSAANYAAYRKYARGNASAARELIVMPACGAGLKSGRGHA